MPRYRPPHERQSVPGANGRGSIGICAPTGKVMFGGQAGAQRVLDAQRRGDPRAAQLGIYACPECNKLHIGHSSR